MASQRPNLFFAIAAAILLGVVSNVEAGVLFSSLNHTLLVTAQLTGGANTTLKVARAGEDTILVKWSLNASDPAGIDASYNTVKSKLCFVPVSQLNRKWRKLSNDLSVDKTCSFAIATQPFTAAGNSVLYTVAKNIPYAEYFVRVYVLNAQGNEVAFGQSTNTNKTTNIFTVDPITGRHATIDIAVAVMSAFSVISLLTFYVGEQIYLKRKKSV